MKFTCLAILPAAAWTVITLSTVDVRSVTDANIGAAILLYGLWLVTWSVVAVYWTARIVRFVLRGARKPEEWVAPPWKQ